MTENTTNISTWEEPVCEVISVSLECTAYAGTLQEEEQA